MNTIIENWYLVLIFIVLIALIVSFMVAFAKLPNTTKIQNVKEWLLYAVVEAERIYKSGTGTLKLHYVYNLAVEKFPWLAAFVTFDIFSLWVDEALEWMRTQLESNQNVKSYVEGE